ncbi:MAG: cytochrome c [Nitrospirae bacterium]|nr:cytochrome c [Nitrospirota bacterium]
MSTFLLKSILSLVLLLPTAVCMFTMFEMFGRGDRKNNIETLRRLHRTAGVFYLTVFAVVTFYCLKFIVVTKTELSVRAAVHGTFSLAVLVLLAVKVLYIRIYKQFYSQAKVFGLLIAFFTFGAVGISAGHYLLVSEFGTDMSYDRLIQYREDAGKRRKTETRKPSVGAAPEAIAGGKNIFEDKCRTCHNTEDTETLVGPGLKGILMRRELPVSKLPATPENIKRQLRRPLGRMPSFDYLTEEEMDNIIAYLNTL